MWRQPSSEKIMSPLCGAIESHHRCGKFAANDKPGRAQNTKFVPAEILYIEHTGVKINFGPRQSCTKIPVVPELYDNLYNFNSVQSNGISYRNENPI